MKPRYSIWVREQGRTIDRHTIDDPFIVTRVWPRGWRNALAVLLRRYEIEVRVKAPRETIEAVLALNSENGKNQRHGISYPEAMRIIDTFAGARHFGAGISLAPLPLHHGQDDEGLWVVKVIPDDHPHWYIAYSAEDVFYAVEAIQRERDYLKTGQSK